MTTPRFKVNKTEAEAFAKVWNFHGVAAILPDMAINFATDFANVVLNNFLAMCQEQAELDAKQKANKLLIEGV